jgi:hypothetical protein
MIICWVINEIADMNENAKNRGTKQSQHLNFLPGLDLLGLHIKFPNEPRNQTNRLLKGHSILIPLKVHIDIILDIRRSIPQNATFPISELVSI